MIDKNAFGFCVATLDLSKGASRAGRDFGDKLLGKLMSAVMWLVFHPQLRTRAQFSQGASRAGGDFGDMHNKKKKKKLSSLIGLLIERANS